MTLTLGTSQSYYHLFVRSDGRMHKEKRSFTIPNLDDLLSVLSLLFQVEYLLFCLNLTGHSMGLILSLLQCWWVFKDYDCFVPTKMNMLYPFLQVLIFISISAQLNFGGIANVINLCITWIIYQAFSYGIFILQICFQISPGCFHTYQLFAILFFNQQSYLIPGASC